MQLHRIGTTVTVIVVSVLGLVACSGAPESSLTAHPPVEGSSLSLTIVRMQKDAKPIITREPTAQGGVGLKVLDCPPGGGCGIVVDPGCAQADLWLFDQPNFSGNELCVVSIGDGFLDLADVPHPQRCFNLCTPFEGCEQLCFGSTTWSTVIRSWSAGPGAPDGDVGGCFYDGPSGAPGMQQCFQPWAYEYNASPIVSAAESLQY